MDNSKALTHLSLCAGYGGIDLGLARALGNVRTIAYVEIDAFAITNLVSKMESRALAPAPIWSDLKTFNWDPFCHRVDIISGGFPCQPFSCAGQRRGDDDPRHLWPYIARGIKVVKPAFIFLENVGGMLDANIKREEWRDPPGTPVALHILRELERLGYQTEAGLFSAEEVGAPHQRKRLFFFSIREDVESLPSLKAESAQQWPAGRGREQHKWEPSKLIR